MAEASKLQLLRDSALAAELDAKQSAALAEIITVRDLKDEEVLVEEGATQASELSNYIFKQHGKY